MYGKLETYVFLPVGCSEKKKKKKALKTLGWSNFLMLQNENPGFKRSTVLPKVIEPVFAIAQRDSWLRFFSTSAL